MIALSRKILERIVPEHFHKIVFIEAEDEASSRGLSADLAINIDSFEEMPGETIDAYMLGLVANCRYFHCKNPVAKHRPENVGLNPPPPDRLLDVFSLGRCRDVINIFSEGELETVRTLYIDAYRPTPDWQVVAERPCDMFPHLHHAIYRKK